MSPNRILLSLGIFLACCGTTPPKSNRGTVDDANGTSGSSDADSDGYDATEDCDDDNPEIHPQAEEVCDGQDNDCDGFVDDADDDVTGTITAYSDDDGDDAVASIYTGATEVWYDGVDADERLPGGRMRPEIRVQAHPVEVLAQDVLELLG